MFNLKLLPASITATLLAGAMSAQAAPEISGNIALTTDYKFRGISQSDESIAVQGGFDIAWDNGMYVGTWASTVDFDSNDGLDGSVELDGYAGWAGNITENIGVDVGYIYYAYTGDDGQDGDYQEIYVNLSLGDASLGAVYSDDYYAESGNFYYLSAGYSFALSENVSLDLSAGYNDVEKDGGFLSNGADSFITYSAGVTASWLAVDWTLAYVGTDLEDDEVFDTNWGDGTAVFTISKSM